jgi:glycerol-3-phosphate acyltransferase PlsY
MILFIIILIGYLLGSIPSAVWVGKRFYGIDVREHGSKNAGATNTFRVLGKKPGKIVLLIDVFKGLLAVLAPQFLFPELSYETIVQFKIIAAVTVILGHVFPLFAGFKGGKGVATALGVIIAIHPMTACICLAIFLIVFLTFNYVSLGAIITAVIFPIILIFVFQEKSVPLILFSIVIGTAVVITHKKNIVRLINGTENKMYLKKRN